jgi:hypothetical protein
MASTSLEWEQDEAEVIARFPVPPTTTHREVQCDIRNSNLKILVSGCDLLVDDSLYAPVDTDESFWALEGGQGTTSRCLVVTLTKQNTGRSWPHVASSLQTASSSACEETLAPAGEAHDMMSMGGLPWMDDGEIEDKEDAEQQQQQEVQLEAKFCQLREERGLDDAATLDAFFEFFNIAIQLYHLNKIAGYLEDVVPVCRKRADSYKLKAIQAHGFVLWKQQVPPHPAIAWAITDNCCRSRTVYDGISHGLRTRGRSQMALV